MSRPQSNAELRIRSALRRPMLQRELTDQPTTKTKCALEFSQTGFHNSLRFVDDIHFGDLPSVIF